MKKQTFIILILCVLVAAVIALSVLGVIGPQGSFAGYTVRNNEVSPPNTVQPLVVNPEYPFPTTP